MRYFSLNLLLFIAMNILSGHAGAQCEPQAALNCEDAPVLCNLSELHGYSCRNPPPPNLAGPTPLCPNGGVPNNMSWWAFVAGSPVTTLQISATNCTTVGGQMGVQAGIYTDCGFGTAVFCQGGCWVGNQQLSAATVPCQTYYVFVDGCSGSECDYTVSVLAGANPPAALDPPMLSGPDTTCRGGVTSFEAESTTHCTPDFIWTLDGMKLDEISKVLNYNFHIPGTFEICVAAFTGNENTSCNESGATCKTIVVRDSARLVERPAEVYCYEDRFGIFFTECATPVPSMPGTWRPCCFVVDSTGCTIKLCKEFVILEKDSTVTINWNVCDKDFVELPDGSAVIECGTHLIELPGANANGCDSTNLYNVVFLRAKLEFNDLRCDSNSYCVSGSAEINCLDTLPPHSTYWTRTETGDTLSVDRDVLCTDIPGEYCYNFRFEIDTLQCKLVSHCITLPPDIQLQSRGDTVCYNETHEESFTFSSGITNYRADWTVKGAHVVESDSLTLSWTPQPDALEAEICYTSSLGNCPMLDTCYFRTIIPPVSADFLVQQSGNEMVFIAHGNDFDTAHWLILGREYTGDTIALSFSRDTIATAEYLAVSPCDTFRKSFIFRFRKSASRTTPHPGGHTLGGQIVEGGSVLLLNLQDRERYECALFDITGRLIFHRKIEAAPGMDLRFYLRENLPPGVYYLAVRNQSNGTVKTQALPLLAN